MISPHTGLGPKSAESGRFANEGIVDAQVLHALNDGAIVINYDRGEVVDAQALNEALSSGKVSYAAIDADLFKNDDSGELSGPMVPYLSLVQDHAGKLELLPHAAADTEHVSRVEGAKQAVNQIFDVILYKSVVNLVGDLPDGYHNAGAKTVSCVGRLTRGDIGAAIADDNDLNRLRRMAEEMAAFWGSLEATSDGERQHTLLDRYSDEVMLNINQYNSLLTKLGLQGPLAD